MTESAFFRGVAKYGATLKNAFHLDVVKRSQVPIFVDYFPSLFGRINELEQG